MGMHFSAPWRTAHTSVLVVGLDNAGKTTILQRIKEANHHSVPHTDIAPTVGVSQEYIQLRDHNLRISSLDLSGHSRYRGLWEHQLTDAVSAIVFVIDSSDTMRFVVAQDELTALLKTPACQAAKTPLPVLMLANKMDRPGSASPVTVSKALGLHQGLANGGAWHICATNALTGEGVEEAVKWLADQVWKVVKEKKKR